MEEVREYMGVRKLSKGLQLRMRKHFDHVYRNTSVFRQANDGPVCTSANCLVQADTLVPGNVLN